MCLYGVSRRNVIFTFYLNLNSLNAELNPICHLLALLGAHHILHVSRIRVKVVCDKNEEVNSYRNNQQDATV